MKTFNGDMFLAVSAYNQGSGTVSRGGFSRGFGTDKPEKFDTSMPLLRDAWANK